MPCSLLSSHNDSYSDISYTSGRSLDSKNSPKKVSFNKAVRVKQYPWKPDLERQTVEHITLPSNRFWFKVYKNKNDNTYGSYTGQQPLYINAWDEEVTDNTPDSLAPIAEVEDQEVEPNVLRKEMKESLNNEYIGPNDSNVLSYHPFEPPIDYFNEMNVDSSYKYGTGKHVGRKGERNGVINNYGSNMPLYSRPWISNGFGNYQNIPEESEVMEQNGSPATEFVPPLLQLPRMSLRSDSTRQSARRLDTSRGIRPRERRSRSHDDHVQEDCQFKHLRRADKSVSTEDLSTNSGSCPNNGFLKASRDMATQCYRTLNHESQPSLNMNEVSRKLQNFQSSNTDLIRLNNFKNAEIKSNENRFALNSHQRKKEQDTFQSSSSSDKNNYQIRNTSTNLNSNYKKIDSQSNGKITSKARISNRCENSLPVQKPNGLSNRILISRSDIPSSSSSYTNGRKLTDNPQTKLLQDSASVGYLKGRQIPLSEVNSNANRKLSSKNESGTSSSLFTRRFENVPLNDKRAKSEVYSSNFSSQQPRKYPNFKNTRPKVELPYPAESQDFSPRGRENSMIDWSLSGFQLATKPDMGTTSVSDSEYTVHRRPPLLMYIPGVSHQDRPAVDDGHLSVLSDLSEGSDGMSLLARDVSKRKSVTSDFRRRHSTPRNGKLRWLK